MRTITFKVNVALNDNKNNLEAGWLNGWRENFVTDIVVEDQITSEVIKYARLEARDEADLHFSARVELGQIADFQIMGISILSTAEQ